MNIDGRDAISSSSSSRSIVHRVFGKTGTLPYVELRNLFGPSVLEAEGFPLTHPFSMPMNVRPHSPASRIQVIQGRGRGESDEIFCRIPSVLSIVSQ
jgi:hypothetical protein